MEHILFAAAEQPELDSARNALAALQEQPEGRIQVDFMLTGIGIASTAYRLTAAICQARSEGNPYSLLIDIGVAGSYDLKRFPVRSAVLVSEEYFGELGFDTASGFRTLFQYQALSPDERPFCDGTLPRRPLPFVHLEKALQEYASAPGVTIQTITADPVLIEERRRRFLPAVESMEGAAFHYVSLMEKIPFFQIRTISNPVGESDSRKWDNEGALETLSACCQRLLRRLLEDIPMR